MHRDLVVRSLAFSDVEMVEVKDASAGHLKQT